jgi:tetratricopeptide (TPR) repeat protein
MVLTEEMTGRTPEAVGPIDGPAPGTTIGRFIVVGTLGAGGMGLVLAAYDPTLDRKVAIKLLRPDLSGGASAEARTARLLREAQALAKIAHRNVLAVHDVGMFGDQVFIALEHVDGETLSCWLERPRPWRDVVEKFVAAGRGLEAAHALGLVHRDFKPDNVLVARDGRVLVTDFGVVGVVGVVDDQGPRAPALPAAGLTRDGMIVGTPGFIAPEQRAGRPVDARADQYAFSVALDRALGPRAPRRLRLLARRGLAEDPAARHPSIAALIGALERRPSGGVLVGAVSLPVLAAAVIAVAARRAPVPVCTGGAARMAAVWNPDVHARMRAAFAATGKPFAAGSFATAAALLDRYASAWVERHDDACAATAERHEQSSEMLDRRMACLGDRLRELDTIAGLFVRADSDIVLRAAGAASNLSSLAGCDDVAALGALPPVPADPSRRGLAEGLRGAVRQTRVLYNVGRYREEAALVAHWLATAPASGYLPGFGEVLYAAGKVAYQADDVARARAFFEGSAIVADRGRDDATRARALAELAFISGYREAKFDEAHREAERAEAALARSGGDLFAEWTLARLEGDILDLERRWPEALERYHRAFDVATRLYGEGSFMVGVALGSEGPVLARLGRYAAAVAVDIAAVAIFDTRVGATHNGTARALNNLGVALYLKGDVEAALAIFRRSASIQEQLFGVDNTEAQAAWFNIGEMLDELGRSAEGLPLEERALAVWEKAFGPDHPRVGVALVGVGKLRLHLDRAAEAVPVLERAVAIRDAKRSTPLERAEARWLLGAALWAAGGDRTRARALVEEARPALAADPAGKKSLAVAERWLSEHSQNKR